MALAVAGLLGSAAGAMPLLAQEAATSNATTGQVVTAYLDYGEVSYSLVNWGVPIIPRSEAFKKEPAFGRGKIARGMLEVRGGGSNEVAFAWDRNARKLYLDLNHNLDLTDDPAGIFTCRESSGAFYQIFTNVHLPLGSGPDSRAVLVDLSFYSYGSLNCSAALRSFWQGKVTLQGEDWQVGLLENPFQHRPSLESDHLLLRPWSERNSSFSALGGSLDAFPFSPKLFLGSRAYQLSCTNEVQGGRPKVRMQFAEQQPKLGELKIVGQFIRRVMLESGLYRVVLDQPGAIVKVPVGSYGAAKVSVKKGELEAVLDGRTQAAQRRITISDKGPATLAAGGPLTNSVSVTRRGRNLALNYQLVGVGGAYQIVDQDRSHPPEFAVYLGDRKIKSGKFQFG